MSKFKYNLISKIRFYLFYLLYKIVLFRDVKKGLGTIYLAELIWMVNMLLKSNLTLPNNFKKTYLETKYGKFFIHPDLLSTLIISPAFEREDINYLLKKIDSSLSKKKKLLFLDIGAYVGLYSVLIGNRYKKNKNLEIIAFEPGTNYLSEPTLELLKKNIQINNLKNIKIKSIGVGGRSGKNRGGIKINTLTGILGKNFAKHYDEIYIKLDIDDFVMDGLKGIIDFVNSSNKTHLFIEDFIERKKVINFLKKNNFEFERKLTEYNSFWIK